MSRWRNRGSGRGRRRGIVVYKYLPSLVVFGLGTILRFFTHTTRRRRRTATCSDLRTMERPPRRSVSPVEALLSDSDDEDAPEVYPRARWRRDNPRFSTTREVLHRIRREIQRTMPFLLDPMYCSGDALFWKDLRPLSFWLPDLRVEGVLKIPLLKAAFFQLALTPYETRNLLLNDVHGEAHSVEEARLWDEIGLCADAHELYTIGHELLSRLNLVDSLYSERVFKWRLLVQDYYIAPLRDSIREAQVMYGA
jgi:hypothetical protein